MLADPATRSVAADATRRAALVRNLQHGGGDIETSHDMYHDDAILEFPQSGERFIGKQRFMEWRQKYPAQVSYRIRRITGGGELWVYEVMVSYNGGPWTLGVSMVQFRGDKIARETIYVTDGWDAPEWRVPWATRFDPHASVAVADWREGSSFGLEAEYHGTIGNG